MGILIILYLIKSHLRTFNIDFSIKCNENTYGHIETSAKDGTGVVAAMTTVSLLALESLRHRARSNKNAENKRNTIKLEGLYSHSTRSSCSTCNS